MCNLFFSDSLQTCANNTVTADTATLTTNFHEQLARSFSDRVLRLTLMPTERCNFRCIYCYENFEQGKMSPDVVAGVKNLIAHRASELDSLTLSWFGGEPTLCPDLMAEVSDHIRAMEAMYHFQYYANMTTNGYLLTPSLLYDCVNWGIRRFQITLDGYGDDHNISRRFANGRGTFGKIWNNLLSAAESDIEFCIILRVHFFQEQWEEKIKLVEAISRNFGDDERFRVHVIGVSKFGGPNDDRLSVASGEEKKRIRLELLSYVPPHMRKIPGEDYENYICYASKGNSFVIRSDGRVSKCTVGLYDDRNIVGKLLTNGTLQVDNDKIRPWFVGFTTGDPGELACPAKHVLWT